VYPNAGGRGFYRYAMDDAAVSALAAHVKELEPEERLMLVDNALPEPALEALIGDVAQCSAIVFATFTTNPMLAGDLPAFVQRLTEGPTPVAFVAFGNPYLLSSFPKSPI
jgi:hypothetical protein